MEPKFDLHSHTQVSDGTLTPSELVARAVEQGVQMLAITDHDTTSGLTEASDTARAYKLRLIPGVEVSANWEGVTVHIIALNIDTQNTTLNTGLSRQRDFRHWRACEIARKLSVAGIPGVYTGVLEHTNSTSISRTHFARYLVAQGHARDLRNCFRRFLVRGRPGFVSDEWVTLAEALGWINAAGGHAVIAHPTRYKMTQTKLRRLVVEFCALGGVGIEVVSGAHLSTKTRVIAQIARDFNLYASAGSDFHSPQQSWSEIGHLTELPVGCKPITELLV